MDDLADDSGAQKSNAVASSRSRYVIDLLVKIRSNLYFKKSRKNTTATPKNRK